MLNLTNINCNRRAWLGQSACCYLHQVPEYLTRKAWANLTLSQQQKADEVADVIINLFNVQNERIDNQLYLFLGE